MSYKVRGFIYGILMLIVLSGFALFISSSLIHFLSPLIIGIIIGALLSPIYPKLARAYDIQGGVSFGAKKLLRAGIVMYGSYITIGEILTLGFSGFIIAAVVVIVIFTLSICIGRVLKLDNDISMLIGIGSAVCGAAAILALESTIKTHPSKSSVALGFIVIFGLCGMLILPMIYYANLLPLSDYQWGIFIGASLHEVANVVGAAAISADSQNVAIIVKMTRVVLLVPLLLIISYIMFVRANARLAEDSISSRLKTSKHIDSVDSVSALIESPQTDSINSSTNPAQKQNALYVPYFAFGFLAVIVLNSCFTFPPIVIESAQFISKCLLVCAMVALGLQIDWQKFISFGAKSFVLSLILFIVLMCGTYTLVYFMF